MSRVRPTAGPRGHSAAAGASLLQLRRSFPASRYDAGVRPGLLDPGGPLDGALREIPALAERLHALPWPAALALAVLGLAALAVGARWRRPLAVVGGAALGWVAGMGIAPWLSREVGVPPMATRMVAAALVAALSGFLPQAFLFAAGALPGALVGSLPQEPVGAWAGLALGGVAGLMVGRAVAAMAAACLGATLLTAAALAASDRWEALGALAERPFVLVTLAAVVAVAGAAYQWRRAWEPPAPRPEHAVSEPASDQAETRAL